MERGDDSGRLTTGMHAEGDQYLVGKTCVGSAEPNKPKDRQKQSPWSVHNDKFQFIKWE